MLYHLQGKIIGFGENYLLLSVGPLGLKVSVTQNTLKEVKDYTEEEICLQTYLHIQENKWEIFGFLEEKERSAFVLLLGCRGIGPKAALNILSVLSPARLKKIALGEESVLSLQQVPGIGAKSADRILVELKEKLSQMGNWYEAGQGVNQRILEYTHEDLFDALKNLGYRAGEIQMAITQSATLPATLSEAVKQLLRLLGRG